LQAIYLTYRAYRVRYRKGIGFRNAFQQA